MAQLDIYRQADKVAEYLMKQYAREFGKARNTGKFDELNIINRSKELYGWLDKITREAYLMLANLVYGAYAKEDGSIAEAWLSGLLDDYDPITKYVYSHEWERKRQRFAESVIASHGAHKEFDTALHLLVRQAVQYTLNVVDKAQMKAYKDNHVSLVKWVSEKDIKVCDVCYKRDGKTFKIGSVPPKPHYGCRCRLEAINK